MHRRFSRRMARRFTPTKLSLAVALAFPAALALTALAQAPARAQIAVPSVVQSAVVLDFDVAPGLDNVLGRKAADAVAVEMKSSGDFDIVTRQRVEELVATIPGLHAPYTPATSRRLGEAASANVVITGRVVAISVGRTLDGVRAARVQMELREMDVATGDFINGAQPSEITVDKLQEMDDDVLLDQSIDKAAYNAVRQIRLYVPAEATITSNLGNNIELNIGLREGVRSRQRYSVLRDRYNVARRIIERVKIAEISISTVDNFESNASVADGGAVGIRIGDKARRIFASGIPFTEPAVQNFTKSSESSKKSRRRR